jgi:hypothetical protein
MAPGRAPRNRPQTGQQSYGQFPSGIRTRVGGLAPLETVKDVTLGPDLDKRDLKRPTAGGAVTAGGAPQTARETLAAAGPLRRSDSKLDRRVPRSQPLPRDPWQVSMNGNGSGLRLWNCLLGRHPGDMETYGWRDARTRRSSGLERCGRAAARLELPVSHPVGTSRSIS